MKVRRGRKTKKRRDDGTGKMEGKNGEEDEAEGGKGRRQGSGRPRCCVRTCEAQRRWRYCSTCVCEESGGRPRRLGSKEGGREAVAGLGWGRRIGRTEVRRRKWFLLRASKERRLHQQETRTSNGLNTAPALLTTVGARAGA